MGWVPFGKPPHVQQATRPKRRAGYLTIRVDGFHKDGNSLNAYRLEMGKSLKKGPETFLNFSKNVSSLFSSLFPEAGPKIKKNQPETMNDQESLAKPSQNQ